MIFLSFILTAVYSKVIITTFAANDYPIIGIVTQELLPDIEGQYPAFSSYIGASYVKAVESSAARVVPIVSNRDEAYYRKLLNSVNGVLLPGGDASIKAGSPYYDTVQKVYKIAKEINDAGVYFPLMSVCLGFEILFTVANNDENLFTNCGVVHENLSINFTVLYTQTSLFLKLTEQQYDLLSTSNVTINNHLYCILEKDFLNSSLKDDWSITSSSVSHGGIEFIASVEHKKYPFFGLQFHPEKVAFEWNRFHNYVHSEEAVVTNRYFYDLLVFYSRRNQNTFETSRAENKSLIYNYGTVIGGDEFFQLVYLF